jgi:hypothetical protein
VSALARTPIAAWAVRLTRISLHRRSFVRLRYYRKAKNLDGRLPWIDPKGQPKTMADLSMPMIAFQ